MNEKEIKEYLLNGKLEWLVDNYSNDNELAEVLYDRLKSNFNYNGNHDKTIQVIINSISKYRSNRGNIQSIIDTLYSDLQTIVASNTNRNYTNYSNNVSNNSNYKSTKNNKKNINIDTDVVEETVKENKSIQDARQNNKIAVEGYVKEVFSAYSNQISKKEEEIDELLRQIGVETIASMEEMEMLDSATAKIMRKNVSFDEILSAVTMYKQTGSKIRLADVSFFEANGYKVIENKVTITDNEGIKYTYDVSNNYLEDSKGNKLQVKYFIPSNYSDLSKLNTVTCLSGQGEMDMYSQTGANSFYFNEISTNAILIVPSKKNKNGVDISKASFSYMTDEIAASTKFAMAFSKQQAGCSNAIIGCSNGGGSAIKIAANSGDLYDNVVSVNYALVMNDQGKGINPGDDNRLSQQEVKKLDGKNVLFVSVDGDSNLNNGVDSYVYMGIKNLLKYSSNVNVSFATNASSNIYANFGNSNYHYFGKNSELWEKCLDTSYSGHGSYHKVFRDLVNSGLFGLA